MSSQISCSRFWKINGDLRVRKQDVQQVYDQVDAPLEIRHILFNLIKWHLDDSNPISESERTVDQASRLQAHYRRFGEHVVGSEHRGHR